MLGTCDRWCCRLKDEEPMTVTPQRLYLLLNVAHPIRVFIVHPALTLETRSESSGLWEARDVEGAVGGRQLHFHLVCILYTWIAPLLKKKTNKQKTVRKTKSWQEGRDGLLLPIYSHDCFWLFSRDQSLLYSLCKFHISILHFSNTNSNYFLPESDAWY